MNRSPGRDLVVGVFVLAGLAAIAWLSVSIGGANYSGPGGKTLHAYFDEIGGLTDRAPVVVGGVKVGRVVSVSLEPDDFRAGGDAGALTTHPLWGPGGPRRSARASTR